jgi:hypothetical protein
VLGAQERPLVIIRAVQTTKDQTLAAGPSRDPTRWQQTLDELLGRIAGHFARWNPAASSRVRVRAAGRVAAQELLDVG